MADLFVSYARNDEQTAVRVAQCLSDAGYQVWRDDQLPAHRAYSEVIEERLKGAKAVIVLWSAEAAKSQWVRAEADAARVAGTLVQATLDGSLPPMPFNQIQCADLQRWSGEAAAAGWRKLIDSIAALAPPAADKPAPRAARRKLSICVLPFQNMSGDIEQEYFSDGISEDITTDLSQVSALVVVARNTAFIFKGRKVSVCEIARELDVSHVLEGSVRKAGQRVRITAQLIDGATGDQLWADRYDRNLDDIFAIQDEISKAIVGALKLNLLPKEKQAIERRGTNNVEAYNLFLMARQFWMTGNVGDRRREQRVMRICGRAVEIDPNYAQAWALLAIAQSSLRYNFDEQVDDGFAAANAALSIDPTIAEAHCPIARRLSEQGRVEEAVAEITRALALDPKSWEVRKEAGRLAMTQRRIADATEHYERATDLLESDFHAWALLSTCYQATGDAEKLQSSARKMVSEAQKALLDDPSNGAALGIAAGGLAIGGEQERAREWIDRAMLLDPENDNMRYNFACIFACHMQDKEAALALLSTTVLRSRTHFVAAQTDPDFDCLRDDPRFAELVERARTRFGVGAAPVVPEG
ncbi:MAG TPA: TIR domain-containing protein [Steroidobacteraceae bacterium]|jgi:adenylate cyclase